MTSVPVRPGPAIVHSGAGAIDELPELLRRDGVSRVLFVHGTRSLRAATPFLPDLSHVDIVEADFAGECSPGEIERLIALAQARRVDAVIGLGGGKVLDTAKAVAHRLERFGYLVPTLASTCSGWSAVSVYYDDQHRHLGHENWETPTRALLLDPRIVFDSPVALFVSGIADTLAKYVETRAAFERLDVVDALTGFGAAAAARCGELAVTLAATAVADMRRGISSAAWTTLAEAAVITSGLVGSFGAAHGRATAAHPINDGLSAIDATRDLLHGVKVAYGVLVQLALEGRWEEIDELRDVYAALDLPRSLADLGIASDDDGALERIAAVATDEHSSIALLDPVPSETEIIAAMRTLERHQAALARIIPAGSTRTDS